MEIKLPYGQHLPRQVEAIALRVSISAGDKKLQKWYTLDELKPVNGQLEVSGLVATAIWNQNQRLREEIRKKPVVQIDKELLTRHIASIVERKEQAKRIKELEDALEQILKATKNKKVHEIGKEVLGDYLPSIFPTPPKKQAPCTALLAPKDMAYMQSLKEAPKAISPAENIIVLTEETFEQALKRGASGAELKAIGDRQIKQAKERASRLAESNIDWLLERILS